MIAASHSNSNEFEFTVILDKLDRHTGLLQTIYRPWATRRFVIPVGSTIVSYYRCDNDEKRGSFDIDNCKVTEIDPTVESHASDQKPYPFQLHLSSTGSSGSGETLLLSASTNDIREICTRVFQHIGQSHGQWTHEDVSPLIDSTQPIPSFLPLQSETISSEPDAPLSAVMATSKELGYGVVSQIDVDIEITNNTNSNKSPPPPTPPDIETGQCELFSTEIIKPPLPTSITETHIVETESICKDCIRFGSVLVECITSNFIVMVIVGVGCFILALMILILIAIITTTKDKQYELCSSSSAWLYLVFQFNAATVLFTTRRRHGDNCAMCTLIMQGVAQIGLSIWGIYEMYGVHCVNELKGRLLYDVLLVMSIVDMLYLSLLIIAIVILLAQTTSN